MLCGKAISVARNGKRILDEVDLMVRLGQITTMVGPNGAGKSTLLEILTGELRADSGQVSLDERSVSEWSPEELARKRAVVPQASSLSFDFLVREVIRMGSLASATDELVEQAIRDVGLQEQSEQVYTTLSGGEKQRTHLARALVQVRSCSVEQSRFLLLDEPTSNLDLVHTEALMQLLRRLAQDNVGVYMIMHDVNLASAWSDHMLVLSKGKMIAEGTPEAVITSDVLKRAFDVDVTIMPHPQSGRPLILPVVPHDRIDS